MTKIEDIEEATRRDIAAKSTNDRLAAHGYNHLVGVTVSGRTQVIAPGGVSLGLMDAAECSTLLRILDRVAELERSSVDTANGEITRSERAALKLAMSPLLDELQKLRGQNAQMGMWYAAHGPKEWTDELRDSVWNMFSDALDERDRLRALNAELVAALEVVSVWLIAPALDSRTLADIERQVNVALAKAKAGAQ